MTEETTEPKKGNRSAIFIALLLVIILVQSVKIYLDYQEKVEVKEQLATTEEDLAGTMQKLTDIQAELNQKITEIEKLGGDVKELQKAKAEVELELKRNNKRSAKALQELKDRVEGYEELLKLKDQEIEKLKNVNTQLFSENKTLKTKQNKLSDSIVNLSKNKDELANKVAIASQLKAENISIKAVNNKGKERDSPFKNRQLQKLKVDFNLAENKVAPIEGKKIIIRIIDENNQVIFDVAKGSGTFIFNGKEEFYTAAQEILFDNTKQKLSYLYEKGSEYAAGKYVVEIFTDNYKIGSGQFEIK
ncbi:MAG TPA: chromosome segregation protein SMC [Cyclobacteriaceae bacterium]|jgi:cell division protein ZapB|nr:chromosome segregation protein SMC [Cyclobacteriaceae bacterium]